MNLQENITQEFLSSIDLPSANSKRLNYLLVLPRIVSNSNFTYSFPYGFALVSSALKVSGRNVVSVNLNHKSNPKEYLHEILVENDIDVVFTGGLSGQYMSVKEVIDEVKSFAPRPIVCVGGGIVTADPAVAMQALEADYGIVGEGEITINAFAYALENGLDLKSVQGIVLADGSLTPERPAIPNLDMLPFPDYDGFEYADAFDKNKQAALASVGIFAVLAVGRSCPYDCTFCFHTSGKKHRSRSIDNIFKEIDWAVAKYNITRFYFTDEMFVYNEHFLEEFTARIARYRLQYLISAHVNFISKKALEMLKNSGCTEVRLGFESADNRILRSMRKNSTVERINEVLDMAREVGVAVGGNIILGDTEETPETITNSLNWLKCYFDDRDRQIYLAQILTFPGTHLYKVACDRGIIVDPVQYLKDGEYQINLTKMTDDEYNDMIFTAKLFFVFITERTNIGFENINCVISEIGANLKHMLLTHTIALWPATYQAAKILELMSPEIISNKNLYFVNKNPHGMQIGGTSNETSGAKLMEKLKLFGKQIYTPSELLNDATIDIVLYPHDFQNDGRVYNEIKLELQMLYPNIKLVKFSELAEGVS